MHIPSKQLLIPSAKDRDRNVSETSLDIHKILNKVWYEVALFVSFLDLIVDEISTFLDEISTDCRSRRIVVFDDMSHRCIVVFDEMSRGQNGFWPSVVHRPQDWCSLCHNGWMDGWMTCHFMSSSTVFQSYQDDGWVIMKGCEQWNLIYSWKDFCHKQGLNPQPQYQ